MVAAEKEKKSKGSPIKVLTFGSFDFLHVGHVNFLRRAAGLGDTLIVGVAADELHLEKKKALPVYTFEERITIVRALRWVDTAFKEESLELRRQYCRDNDADILVVGEAWLGSCDHLKDICEVIYLPHTEKMSKSPWVESLHKAG